ncbi:MAG: right-handed parallel beta-helix repeat-containing protein, partial [Armatimonadetes bacterium]|nr:right-handed parallel beta-helix repeat-containing protein [Armatimonadota bacterium]
GEPGRPLVLAGERGPVGEWLTVIDPGVPAAGWEPADEVGPDVFKTKTLGFNPSVLTVDGRHIGKIDDRVMAGTRRVAWGPGETGFVLLALPADAQFDYAGGRWRYWDHLRAAYGYRDGVTYIRFQHGDDPRSHRLLASPRGAGITLSGVSHVVVRDLRIQGALDAVLIRGSGARGNTVERCSLSHGKARVRIQDGAAGNLVRDNLMTWGFYGTDSFGVQLPGAEGAGRFLTYRIYHSGNFFGSDWGIQVGDAGPGNEVSGNRILNGLVGVFCLRTSGLRFHRNVISNLSNVAMVLSTGGVDNRFHDNLMYVCTIGIRIHNYNAPAPRQSFIYRNLFFSPEEGGTHLLVHALPNECHHVGRRTPGDMGLPQLVCRRRERPHGRGAADQEVGRVEANALCQQRGLGAVVVGRDPCPSHGPRRGLQLGRRRVLAPTSLARGTRHHRPRRAVVAAGRAARLPPACRERRPARRDRPIGTLSAQRPPVPAPAGHVAGLRRRSTRPGRDPDRGESPALALAERWTAFLERVSVETGAAKGSKSARQAVHPASAHRPRPLRGQTRGEPRRTGAAAATKRASRAAQGRCPPALGAGPRTGQARREEMRVVHPNLFLNRAEIEGIREKIRRHEWAGRLYERLLAQADDTLRGGHEYDLYYDSYRYPSVSSLWGTGRRVRDVALAAVLTGERKYADYVREILRYYVAAYAEELPPLEAPRRAGIAANPWAFTRIYDQLSQTEQGTVDALLVFGYPKGGINLCWAYDLICDQLTPAEREAIEGFFVGWARQAMVPLAKRPAPSNRLMWGRAYCSIVGYTVGDRELIDFGIEVPGGVKDVLEKGYRDRVWYGANCYDMVYVSSAMAAVAEAALHADGTDLYRWRSPGGTSMKDFYDACLSLAFPVDLRVATHGDQGAQSPFVSPSEMNTGHQVGDFFLSNDRDGRDWNKYDLAYRRYRDPAYAWVLAQNPDRDEWDHALWGTLALTHGEPLPERTTPPPAPSSLFPENGLAMLRADETPAYWTSGCPAVFVRFGATKVGHGHDDPFHITFHGKGRLLEPDWFLQWDYGNRGGRNPVRLSAHPAGHNTLLVDKTAMAPLTAPLTVAEHEFGAAVKVLRITGGVYPGVAQTRTLALTGEYLLDLFEVRSAEEHTYDWILHALGDLSVPGLAFSPFDIGADLGFGAIDTGAPLDAENRLMRNGMRAAAPETWSALWRQEEGVGVQVTMLGAPETALYRADGPYYVSQSGPADRPADGKVRSIPLVVARRHCPGTVFVALHEPFDGSRAPRCRLRQIRASEGILGFEIRSAGATDYFFYAERLPGSHLVESEIGSFQLKGGYGFIRGDNRGTATQGLSDSAGLDLRLPPESSDP